MFVLMILTVSLVAPEWYDVKQHGTQRYDTLAECQQAAATVAYTPPAGRDFRAICSRRWFGQDIR